MSFSCYSDAFQVITHDIRQWRHGEKGAIIHLKFFAVRKLLAILFSSENFHLKVQHFRLKMLYFVVYLGA